MDGHSSASAGPSCPFPPDALPLPPVAPSRPSPALPEQYALPHTKAIDLIGEEFVVRSLKTEPSEATTTEPMTAVTRPSVVMSVSSAAAQPEEAGQAVARECSDQPNLVYCNLQDLDFASGGEGGVYTTMGGNSIGGMQEMIITSSNSGLLQMVQSVPCFQVAGQQEKQPAAAAAASSPYSAVSTILLQGGILQLKSDPGQAGGGLGGGATAEQQVLNLPLDTKTGLLAQELLKAQQGQERMLPGQVQGQPVMVTSADQSGARPQDAIASILASMESHGRAVGEGQTMVSLGGPVDYSGAGEHVVTMVEEGGLAQPLNLATIQGGQAIQVQGIKRLAQSSPGGGIVTKKVIIATINGTQRILTPVSSPQMIAVKSTAPRSLLTSESCVQEGGGGTPLTIIQQKPSLMQAASLLQRPKLTVTSPTPIKSMDNKTCRWKFENGQICGKIFTKTYNLTVHMRMHQDIRPFPCTICEQTFRQKAHLQRHEATHGIDSTAGRKRRKRSLLDGMEGMGMAGRRMSESEEEEGVEEAIYRHSFTDAKRKFTVGSVLKTEAGGELELDPMIEPIEGSGSGVRKLCPITVGTNTEVREGGSRGREQYVDELEEDMEPVRYRGREAGAALQVEQGVQYSEADLLDHGELQHHHEVKFVPASSIDAPQVAAMQTQVSMSELMDEEGDKALKVEGEVAYSSQTHYVEQETQEYLEEEEMVGEHQLIDEQDGSYIDASENQIVMSGDGGLVRLVSMHQGENVVNIVTSTATNEHGQQIVIIENLDQHSPELQREIMRALLADPSIVPASTS